MVATVTTASVASRSVELAGGVTSVAVVRTVVAWVDLVGTVVAVPAVYALTRIAANEIHAYATVVAGI